MTPVPVPYMPAPHSEQLLLDIIPTPVENKPVPQPTHAVETLDTPTPVPYVPPTHGVHWAAAGRPRAVEYVPATQLEQTPAAVAASAVEYCPAPQRPTHAAPMPSEEE